jgi:ParB family chromosome partitioning protein
MSSDETRRDKTVDPLTDADPAALRDAAARAAQASGLSIADWLSDAVKDAGAEEARRVAESAAASTNAALPDWLADTIKEASAEEARLVAENAARSANAASPDWLADTIKEASAEEARRVAERAAKSSHAALPDWLADTIKEASAEEARLVVAENAAKSSNAALPDWLADTIKEASAEEARLVVAENAAKSSNAALPDWLADTIKEASAAEGVTTEAPAASDDDDELPEWLAEAIREASAEQSRDMSGVEQDREALPEWLGDAIREVSEEELSAANTEAAKPAPNMPPEKLKIEAPRLTVVTPLPVERAKAAPGPKLVTPIPEERAPEARAPDRLHSAPAATVPAPRTAAPTPPAASTPISPSPATPTPAHGIRRVPIDALTPSRFQVRTGVAAAEIEALAESIRVHGVLQPIVVRARGAGSAPAYEIIAGERRWRASQKAGLAEVPVTVIEVPDREAMEIALAENLQRHNLAPLDEAEGYRRLVEDLGDTQEHLAQLFGKSRGHISNMLRLLRLPEPIKAMLAKGQLSAGHARALLAVADPLKLAERAVAERLTVRAIERIGREETGDAPAPRRMPKRVPDARDPDLEQIEEELSRLFGVTVKIGLRGASERGTLTIRFKSLEQLHELIERLRL